MHICVVFTCYNRIDKTRRCIESLYNQGFKISFIVVDDNSTDGTKEMLKGFKNLETLDGNGSLFWNGGMHKGLGYALRKYASKNDDKPDYLLMVNDDVSFYGDSLSKMIEQISQKRSLLVGTVCDSRGQLAYGGVRSLSKSLVRLEKNGIDNTEPCDTFNANCVMIPWDYFEKVGNIDPLYKHAMGDFDYGFMYRSKGYSIYNTMFYVGECETNSSKGTWEDPALSIKERIKKKESIKGLPAKDWWHFVNKNYGFFSAIYHSITPYVRIFMGK